MCLLSKLLFDLAAVAGSEIFVDITFLHRAFLLRRDKLTEEGVSFFLGKMFIG